VLYRLKARALSMYDVRNDRLGCLHERCVHEGDVDIPRLLDVSGGMAIEEDIHYAMEAAGAGGRDRGACMLQPRAPSRPASYLGTGGHLQHAGGL